MARTPLALGRQPGKHGAAVARVALPADQAGPNELVDDLGRMGRRTNQGPADVGQGTGPALGPPEQDEHIE